MDEVIANTKKTKDDEAKIESLPLESKQNSEIIDSSMFDNTLREIDQILNNLEQNSKGEKNNLEDSDEFTKIKSVISKVHLAKNELIEEGNNFVRNNNLIKRIEILEKNIRNSRKLVTLSDELNNENIAETKEHKIDLNLLSLNELSNFNENSEKEKENFFGFYSYLFLIFIIFFALYGFLNISKDLIILKYPITRTYIEYFFEIIEIIKLSILNIADFVKNKI